MSSKQRLTQNRSLRTVVAILIILGVVIITIFLLLRGRTTVTGAYPNSEKTDALICTKRGIKYPKITEADSDDKEIRIIAIFGEKTALRSISLNYTLGYSTEEEVKQAEAKAHFEFGSHLGNYGFEFGEFENKFSMYEDKLVVSLYDDEKVIKNTDRAGYFMLGDEVRANQNLDTTVGMRKAFEKKGFDCEISTDGQTSLQSKEEK